MTDAHKEHDTPELEELDVEEYAQQHTPDHEKPRARFYIIRIDRVKKRVSQPALTGAEILALVDKTPESHQLYQKLRGGNVNPVDPFESVDFTRPGVERFQTIPKDTTEG